MELLVGIFILSAIAYIAMKRKFDKFVDRFKNIPMLDVLPFFGHSFKFFFLSPSEVLSFGLESIKKLGGTSVFIMGFSARVFFTDPKDVEAIFTNKNLNKKADFYGFLADWLGDGLLLSHGEKWRKRRKIITKSFHFQILEEFVEVFDKNSCILVDQLMKSENSTIDIFHKAAMCTLDVICETSMGVVINAQTDSDSEYVDAVKKISEITVMRLFNPFMQLPWIFRCTPSYYKQRKLLKILHSMTDGVIAARRREISSHSMEEVGVKAEKSTSLENEFGTQRKLALLDVLFQSTIDGKPLNDMEIREEVDTFMFEAHDTTTSGIAFCLYNLAKHPEVQQKAFEEIKGVLGDDVNKAVTQKGLNDLRYLEFVIKESLRMFPSVPMFAREAQEDVVINGKFIPKGTNLMIAAVVMGSMESIWEKPESFIPERFERNSESFNPFAFVPFSAGSRNCVGQKFAMLEMKTVLLKVLQSFEVLVDSDFKPVLVAELILRSENGVMLNFKKRTQMLTQIGT